MAVTEYTSIKGERFGLGKTGEIVVDGTPLDVTSVPQSGDIGDDDIKADASIDLSKLANVAEITTAGGTTLAAASLQDMLQAIADLADPAA